MNLILNPDLPWPGGREIWQSSNLVPRAHMSFGQRQDTELWNNQLLESTILGLPASQRMRDLQCVAKNMTSRDKVDLDAY